MTERTNDSILRIPQRLKNALSIVVAAAVAEGCTPKPTQPPIGATEMPGRPTPTHVETIPPPTITPLPPEQTPTQAPLYAVGLENFQNGYRNEFSFADRLANGIPQAQLDAERAYLASHPDVTGQNAVSPSIDAQKSVPFQTLTIAIDKENIISINESSDIPGLFEMVFVQSNPDSTVRSIVHLLVDMQAQQHVAADHYNPLFNSRLVFPNRLSELIDGKIQIIDVNIFMNSRVDVTDPNPDGMPLVDDPAFARVKQVVDKEGATLLKLAFFAIGPETDAEYQALAYTINGTTYIAPYAIIP